MQSLDNQHFTPSNFDDLEGLTRREEKILRLATEDLSNEQIADKLNVCSSTIKKHRENIYRKYSICGRIEVRHFLRRVREFFEKSKK